MIIRNALMLGAVICTPILAAASASVAETPQSLTLATGSKSGVYHPLGTAMAGRWSNQIPNVVVTPEASFASVTNMLLLQADLADLALVQNDIASYAYNGEEMFLFQPNAGNSLGLAVLYPEPVQIVTLAGSSIERVEDLVGRRVAVGAVGSGTEVNARQIMDVHGFGYDDLAAFNLTFEEAAVALRDQLIDAAFITAGLPTAAVANLHRLYGLEIRLIGIAPDRVAEILDRWPHYSSGLIEADRYPGLEEDVATVAVSAMLVGRRALAPELVTDLLEVLYRPDTLARLCSVHRSGCNIRPQEALAAMPIPLHPGASAFFGQSVPAVEPGMVRAVAPIR